MSIGTFDTKNISKQTTVIWWICVGVSLAVGVYSLVSPPPGSIDRSVLDFVGLMLAFPTIASARECIKEGMAVRVKHGDTELEVKK